MYYVKNGLSDIDGRIVEIEDCIWIILIEILGRKCICINNK